LTVGDETGVVAERGFLGVVPLFTQALNFLRVAEANVIVGAIVVVFIVFVIVVFAVVVIAVVALEAVVEVVEPGLLLWRDILVKEDSLITSLFVLEVVEPGLLLWRDILVKEDSLIKSLFVCTVITVMSDDLCPDSMKLWLTSFAVAEQEEEADDDDDNDEKEE
jgi:hypothetical protein